MKPVNAWMTATALAAGAFAGTFSTAAMAQVTVYGIIDTGVEYVSNTNAAGAGVVKMPSLTGTVPSRIGFKGAEDLGGGLQALFVLEAGFTPDTGGMGQGNRLFGRQSYVGLKNQYGTVMLGRQVNMTYIAGLKADILGPNIYGTGSIDSYLPNARSDNAIGYLGTFSGVTVGGTYSFGRDTSSAGGPSATNCAGEVAGNPSACRQITGLLAYDSDSKTFGVAAAYDKMNGGSGASAPLTSADYSDRRLTLNGYALFGDLKIGAGLENRKIAAAANQTSNMYFIGASYPFATQWIVDGQVIRYKVKDSDKVSTLSVLRLGYNLSKRTMLYTSLGYMKNSSTAAVSLDPGGTVGTGMNQLGVMTGIRHAF